MERILGWARNTLHILVECKQAEIMWKLMFLSQHISLVCPD